MASPEKTPDDTGSKSEVSEEEREEAHREALIIRGLVFRETLSLREGARDKGEATQQENLTEQERVDKTIQDLDVFRKENPIMAALHEDNAFAFGELIVEAGDEEKASEVIDRWTRRTSDAAQEKEKRLQEGGFEGDWELGSPEDEATAIGTMYHDGKVTLRLAEKMFGVSLTNKMLRDAQSPE